MARRQQPEIVALYPEQAVGAVPDGELVIVLRPRYMRGPLAWWLQPRLRNPHFKVHLDELGSFVWRCCDGRRSVAQIAEAMDAAFENQEQVLQRVIYFVRELERGKMIRLLEQPRD